MHQYICDSIRKECAKNWGHAGHPQSRLFSIGAKDSIYKRVEDLIKSDVVVDAGEQGERHNIIYQSKTYEELQEEIEEAPRTESQRIFNRHLNTLKEEWYSKPTIV